MGPRRCRVVGFNSAGNEPNALTNSHAVDYVPKVSCRSP